MVHKLGKIIIVLSFIVSLNPYALVLMIPIYIIGVGLLWFKRTNILSNAMWSILPIILWYPALALITLGQGYTDQKFDIYFVQNYTGNVTIVSDMECGQAKQKKNGREQLYIPSNGILLYKGSIKAGIVDHKYYYRMENDSLVQIPSRSKNGLYYNTTDNKPPSDLKVAWGGGRGYRYSHWPEAGTKYTYNTLAIGSQDSMEVYYKSEKYKTFESLTDNIVSACIGR